MLSGLLKSDIAVKVNIQIINAFVYMRKYISKDLNNNILINHENRILKLEESFNKLNNNTKVNTVFYDGQIYDAYSLFMDILNKAKKEIIIIDKDILYTCGSSFKDLGKKCFYIGLIEDREILNNIISKLTNVQGCKLQP